jgi:hypothetical protein
MDSCRIEIEVFSGKEGIKIVHEDGETAKGYHEK